MWRRKQFRGLRLNILRCCLLFFVTILLFHYMITSDTEANVVTVCSLTNISREIQMKPAQNFTNHLDIFQPINIFYQHLAGSRPQGRKYLSIGISSVKRSKGSYLADTLRSIFEKSSPEELEEMVVVLYLADFDALWNVNTAEEMEAAFGPFIDAGQLVIIHCSRDIYPTLEGLKRNFDDPENRVRFRSKQNADYAFLVNYCANLSGYFLMLEDDVLCAKNFLSLLKKFIASAGSSWTTLMFSKLGYIGKLYHSADLAKLAKFLLMFYDEMPCDWLLEHFHRVKAQPKPIGFKPSLFQHMGTFSSFQGTRNKLKDDDFVEFWDSTSDNPAALAFTDIEVYEEHQPIKAYSIGDDYFWGKSPKMGNYVLLVFADSIRIKRLQMWTGSMDHQADTLASGLVQLGRGRETAAGQMNCISYSKLGDFREGKFEMEDFMTEASDKVDCVRIVVTGDQSDWLIINRINVWILKEK